MTQPLLLERRGELALLTLNALSIELRFQLAAALEELRDDDAVVCLVMTGAGSAFCSGMDTGQFGGDAENRRLLVESSTAAFNTLGRFPKPIVAAVNGPAVAGGFAIALTCDLRLASDSARFGFPELPAGIPPAYAAARASLDPLLARELCLTGRVIDADEALRRNVVTAVHPQAELLDRALEVAQAIAAAPRTAVIETKRRILIEREAVWGPLFQREQQAFMQALAGGSG
jgi:enoyl-CoA hydratase/carnithine racemase